VTLIFSQSPKGPFEGPATVKPPALPRGIGDPVFGAMIDIALTDGQPIRRPRCDACCQIGTRIRATKARQAKPDSGGTNDEGRSR
jgi:hypothetical protein